MKGFQSPQEQALALIASFSKWTLRVVLLFAVIIALHRVLT